jgi:hypothetical protein
MVLSGGSYDTATSDARIQDVWGKNSLGAICAQEDSV